MPGQYLVDYLTGQGVYTRVGAAGSFAAPYGQGVAVNTATAGAVTFTLASGGTLVVTIPVGTTILPISISAFAAGTATGATAQALYA